MDTVTSPQAALPETHAETHGEGEVFDPALFRPKRRGLTWSAGAGAVFFGCLVATGLVPRITHRSAMAAEARMTEERSASVTVVRAERSAAASRVELPGSVEPFQETAVYARANGYVRQWFFDIGAHVKRGQVMAELEVPDIDKELRQAQASARQARAQIRQAETQLELARITDQRYAALGPSGVVSQQEVDRYRAEYDAQQANVVAAEAAHGSAVANVERLQDLESFGVIVAPFDGVVTARTAEVGQLVMAGTGSGKPLFKVAEVETVRVFVNVPQLYAGAIAVGMDAPTTVREVPGREFAGKVARTAHELDVGTRTLLTEVDVPNPDDALLAGMYGQVSLRMTGRGDALLVPATAVLIDAGGTRVAVVRDGALSWRRVEIAGDLGDRLAISAGLVEGDVVVAAPSERMLEGTRIRAIDLAPAPSSPPAQDRAESG
jgi:membrane fusion protein, multidrug efflux system